MRGAGRARGLGCSGRARVVVRLGAAPTVTALGLRARVKWLLCDALMLLMNIERHGLPHQPLPASHTFLPPCSPARQPAVGLPRRRRDAGAVRRLAVRRVHTGGPGTCRGGVRARHPGPAAHAPAPAPPALATFHSAQPAAKPAIATAAVAGAAATAVSGWHGWSW